MILEYYFAQQFSYFIGDKSFYVCLLCFFKYIECGWVFSKMKVHDLLQEGLRSKKSPLEIHHLFPKAYLISIGITEQQQTNQIANYALVEWSDNIKIADTAPASIYLNI